MADIRYFELGDADVEVRAERNECSVEFTISKLSHSSHPWITGYVKWDGCSNWDFPQAGKNYTHPLHFYSRQSAIEFGQFLGKLYVWAAELLPESKDVLSD